jgi:hypothetical protein
MEKQQQKVVEGECHALSVCPSSTAFREYNLVNFFFLCAHSKVSDDSQVTTTGASHGFECLGTTLSH